MARARFGFVTLLGGLLLMTGGCATSRVPAITAAGVSPADLHPGQTALITVDVRDYHGIVAKIEGTVEGYPERTFRLRDDGVAPDAVAEDGTWTMDVSVPFTAPAGEHVIHFRAMDSQGRVIPVPDSDGNASELSTDIHVSITYPDAAAEPAPAP